MTLQRGQKVTIYDVADVVGVSSSTVSRVLAGRGQIAAATRQSVLDAAAQLGYRPNTVARSLASGATDTLAILLPDLTNPFFPELVGEIQGQAERHGITVLLCNTHRDPDIERRFLNTLLSHQVQHVLCCGLALDRRAVEESQRAGLTFIGIDRAVAGQGTYLVQTDNRRGGYLATKHLLDLGHRRIAHVSGPANLDVARQRQRGYVEALAEAGIEPDEALVVSGQFSEEAGADAFAQLRSRGAGETAIFAANDLVAIGVLFAAHESGLRVPEDMSLVGFDDVSLTKYVSPQLTTVRQDVAAMAEAAVKIVVSADGSKRRKKITLATELIVRQSTRGIG